ncbi:hypothetical protein [Frigoriflavimonas asaccharolytica]|uniref:Uncharacterized protein n=1 Tax=Frigoriflavimonas asaccharolytica TaxID=2735899 RepID=A0A8J8G8E2_9FLAO|nr:hypothetical protein [Frigoriflavimonas asaccharolytica]NRS93221.1 hypothetical protein [Frigoriflavimonas asaccharolytica]
MNSNPESDFKISKKKTTYPINEPLLQYLKIYSRTFKSPITYEDLLRFTDNFPILDKDGKDTLWEGVMYNYHEMNEIHENLIKIYQRLNSDGNEDAIANMVVDSIDFCTFGNSHPFRIKIRNQFNDNHDYFYVKKADASRIYGLELEYILSPNRINFLVYQNTLIEEHIAGIPGDLYLEKYLNENTDRIRLAKEFVKFNERCFLRLLGDQRAYNFVIVLTPDFDQMQYRIRSIDFDQQSYEGKMNLYKPQFFRENLEYVQLVAKNIDESSIRQYQKEERSLLAKRMLVGKKRLNRLIKIMKKDEIAPYEKMETLKMEIYDSLKDNSLKNCESMGDIVEAIINFTLRNYQDSIIGK